MSQYRVKIPSPEIFVKCREELKLSLEDAIRLSNVKSLAKIEKGEKEPTVKQLESLASTYFQPKWIFSEKSLPSNYNYNFTSEFRTIDKNNLNLSYEVKRLIKEVEALREIMIDLKEQTDEPVLEFSPPLGDKLSKAGELARKTRDWLGISIEQQFKWKDEKEAFKKWREVLESKEIFIFLTSNYKGTFKIEIEAMRGFSLYFKKCLLSL